MRTGFITGGCWCLDNNKVIEAWPAEDQAISVVSTTSRGGGSACNFAIDLRRLEVGMPVETIGLVGDDQNGRFLIEQARVHGIRHDQLQTTREAATHLTDAYASLASGLRTHIGDEGASHLLSPEHFDLDRTSGRILHLGLPGLHRTMDQPWQGEASGWVAVLRAARARGIRTNLELATIPVDRIAALAGPCLAHLDTLVVNDREIGAIAGLATLRDGKTDEAACRAAAGAVLERGAMSVVAVHFPSAAFAVARDGGMVRKGSVAVPADQVRGANGAGDAFAAGFLLALHDGGPLEEALALAHAAAAASLRDVTTTDGLASRAECLALAQAWGWRP